MNADQSRGNSIRVRSSHTRLFWEADEESPLTRAHINAVGTAVPDHEVHQSFIDWAESRIEDRRVRTLFKRMAGRAGIRNRWSVLPPAPCGGTPVEPGGFYHGERLPSTGARMKVYAEAAPRLAVQAVRRLEEQVDLDGITHLVVASCTGFVAPGVDQLIAAELGLAPNVERTLVGFMGCYAAVSSLRLAHHLVRSCPEARVLVVTVELCTLHLQDDQAIEPLLAMLQFGDGATASLVTADAIGLAIFDPFAATLPDSRELIRWTIGDQGFVMHLSGEVPARISEALADSEMREAMFGETPPSDIDSWAVHAGGRSILDAVEHSLELRQGALAESRGVLERYGNMSSSTLPFVLSELLARPSERRGVALAFGPGLAAEGFHFRQSA